MDSPACLSFGPYRLDPGDGRLWRGSEPVVLPPKALAVLQYLAERAGRLVSKQELLDALWPETFVEEAVLKVQISEIRKALGDNPRTPAFVETVHRRGYRFVASVTALAPGTLRSGTMPPSHRRLTGRDAQIATLFECYRSAAGGQRQIVFVSGEGGIGKTALVDTFAAMLPVGEARYARGQCLEHHGDGEAYLPVLEALGQLGRETSGTHLTDVLRQYAPSWLAHLPWALSPGERDDRLRDTARTSREGMQREIAEALEVLSAEHLLVVTLEDLHWADASSIELLARIAHRRARCRLLIVATYRPVEVVLEGHPLRALRQRLTQQLLCTEIQLPYLSAADVDAYLAQRLGGCAPPPGLAELIRERSGGNALFVVNLVDDLLARRALIADDTHARLTVPARTLRAAMPEGVRQMIESQIERLPAADVLRLEAASVAGEEFLTAAVAAVTDDAVGEVERFCEREQARSRYLEAVGVARLPDGETCGRYRFTHTLYREVLYRRLASPRRATWHQRLGLWLEQRGASPAELAHHFVEAAAVGCAAKAAEYSRRAAARAAALFAYTEAAQHYETALQCLDVEDATGDRGADRGAVLIALGEAYVRTGNLALAFDRFMSAADLARRAMAPQLFARAVLGMGRGQHVVLQTDDRLIALLEEANEQLGSDDVALRASVLARLDTALSPMAGTQARRAALRAEALALAQQADHPETWLWVLLFIRWGATLRTAEREAYASAVRLARLTDQATTREHVMYIHLLRIADLLEDGDLPAGTAALAELGALAEASALPWFLWSVHRFRTMLALQAGDFAAAKRLADDAVRAAEVSDDPNVWAAFRAQSVHRYVMQGRFEEVEPVLRSFVEAHAHVDPPRVALANLYMQAGDLDAARRHFEVLAAHKFNGIPRDALWLISMSQVVELCAALDDAPRAAWLRQMLRGYLDRIIGAGSGLTAMGHGDRYGALLDQTLGRWDEAAHGLDRAVEIHARLEARPWLAYALLDRARLRLRRPQRRGGRAIARRHAEEDLRRAGAIADEIGMHGIQQQIERIDRQG
jgi:DNA-binding winged helix-turn-helix (wHTH) protein/tetratricopeptide (TPR) repeat protein